MNDSPGAFPLERPSEPPVISYLLITLCVAIYAYVHYATGFPGHRLVINQLTPNPVALWDGAYWGVISSAFVHAWFLELGFNLWWLREFGSFLEPTMGRVKFLLFIIASAAIGSGAQFALLDHPGLGLSGVIYALFGYLVAGRHAEPVYHLRVTRLTVQVLLGWHVAGLLLATAGVGAPASGAQLAGFVFGYCAGNAFVSRRFVTFAHAGMAGLTAVLVIALNGHPWSPLYQRRAEAAEFYAAVDMAHAGDARAQELYGAALVKVRGREQEGMEWLRKAARQGDVMAMNALAWYLATSMNDALRNGREAVTWAEKACTKDGWKTPALLDTLAAAHAEVGNWEQAVSWQNQAISKHEGKPDPNLGYERRLQQYLKREKARE